MYFENFDFIRYDFTTITDDSPIIENIVDLSKRVQLRITQTDLDRLCDKYVILDGETPEKISYKLYNNPLYHWTILYINEMINYHMNWPLSDLAIVEFCKKKYGEDHIYDRHHYEKITELIVMDDTYIQEQINLGNFDSDSLVEVSNLEYEERQNTLKRFIKVISPNRISGFLDMYNEAMIKT